MIFNLTCSALAAFNVRVAGFHGAEKLSNPYQFDIFFTIDIDPLLPLEIDLGDDALAFRDDAERGQPFPAATAFVPRWQVGLAGETGTAVANLQVSGDSDIDALALRVWRAHRRLREVGQGEGAVSPSRSEPARFKVHEAGDYRTAVARALARIESGEMKVNAAILDSPIAVREIIEIGEKLKKHKIRVKDLIKDAEAEDQDRGQSDRRAGPGKRHEATSRRSRSRPPPRRTKRRTTASKAAEDA